ncbi:Similar to CHORD: Cysteine and histidine-rich domain-containing protein (Drosophila melanogaster) [Cotesia congregata]|uniref:Similar to CHORD: Cysteine and histidine-rich domain-containing protein (Drosophila melanogaster) n=1 Tax=Cotesia congregata TaxID=51543 RepID=A0A8J2H4X4_COTCN|nr:Similar to CHORD: Cysteine and histidine-rich domain-containing protein (Drosophila melanogaster) [Cotesia congregata]
MSGKKLLCYHRGCGQDYDPDDNKPDSCVHHPGVPVFHDAYKGWSCCNKKCTDFTEFLNIKGCTKSEHSNEKPPEPEKPAVDKSKAAEVIEYRAPVNTEPTIERPPFDTPQKTMQPVVSQALMDQVKSFITNTESLPESLVVKVGQSCKNRGCSVTFTGTDSDNTKCVHHPGVPVFHEGLKYWSCCPRKKMTDFDQFEKHPGCSEGTHVWIAKVVDVENSSVQMLPTKVEIKLKKEEPNSWSKLDIPKETAPAKEAPKEEDNSISERVDAVDLNDL